MHDYMVPPEDVRAIDVVNALWKTEFDVTATLAATGHDVYTLGLGERVRLRRGLAIVVGLSGIIVVLQTLVFLTTFVFAPKHGMLAARRRARAALMESV